MRYMNVHNVEILSCCEVTQIQSEILVNYDPKMQEENDNNDNDNCQNCGEISYIQTWFILKFTWAQNSQTW